jgi:chromosomal replication initiation ATPase DnaA
MDERTVIQRVLSSKGMSEEDFYGRKRTKDLCLARALVMYYLHFNMNVSTYHIADSLNRNRRNVCRWMAHTKFQLEHDTYLQSEYRKVLSAIGV